MPPLALTANNQDFATTPRYRHKVPPLEIKSGYAPALRGSFVGSNPPLNALLFQNDSQWATCGPRAAGWPHIIITHQTSKTPVKI